MNVLNEMGYVVCKNARHGNTGQNHRKLKRDSSVVFWSWVFKTVGCRTHSREVALSTHSQTLWHSDHGQVVHIVISVSKQYNMSPV